MSDYVIETCGLTRYFGRKCAVDQLDLSVPRGGVFALLGRNGSGKTTLIRMLLGLLAPTRGTANILGHDCGCLPPAVRARIGYLAEGHFAYGWMRLRECGRFQARCFPRWNDRLFRSVLGYFHLDLAARVKDLSRGERAGVCLALTMAIEPELFVLDDPALGLDVVARRALLEAVVHVTRQEGRTVFICSHLMSDVERVADRIAVLERGHLRACGSVETFRRRVQRFVLRFAKHPPELPVIPGLLQCLRTETELALTVANLNGQAEGLIRGLGATSVEEVALSLEEAFLSYLDDRGERSFFLHEAGAA